jgi:hypothetical protein
MNRRDRLLLGAVSRTVSAVVASTLVTALIASLCGRAVAAEPGAGSGAADSGTTPTLLASVGTGAILADSGGSAPANGKSSQWAPRSGPPYNGSQYTTPPDRDDPANAPANSAPNDSTPAAPPGGIDPRFPAGLPMGAGPRGPMRPPQPAQPAQPGTGSAAGAPASGPDEDIRDIRGPVYIIPAWLIPALIAGVILLALAGYAVWRWMRRPRRTRALLPFELALQRLENIRLLMQPQNAREFSTAVSDIVRSYIEQRFDVIATHRTTEEFLRDLLETTNASLAKHRALLSEFLHQCDLVKFGGMSLTLQNMESLHDSARVFVLETAKPEEPAPADKNSAGSAATQREPVSSSASTRLARTSGTPSAPGILSSSGPSASSRASTQFAGAPPPSGTPASSWTPTIPGSSSTPTSTGLPASSAADSAKRGPAKSPAEGGA